jgi:hypothetical protein
MMLKSRSWRLFLMAVVAGVGAIGYSYASGHGGGKNAVGALTAEGSCPLSAMRAAFWGHRAPSRPRPVDAGATLTAIGGGDAAGGPMATLGSSDRACEEAATRAVLAAAEGDCPTGSCPGAAALTSLIGSMIPGDPTLHVSKTAGGVVIRISSKQPEVVRMIQARFESGTAGDTSTAVSVKASSTEIVRK